MSRLDDVRSYARAVHAWVLAGFNRAEVARRLADEEADLKLQAVVGPEHIDAARTWVDRAVKRSLSITRPQAVDVYIEHYCLTGEHPT